MIGQISLNIAKTFHEKISLSGIIATKTEADARGGAILSCKFITGLPIKFITTGEKIQNLEIFIAKRIVDRILDQGDITSLLEKFSEIEEEEAEKLQKNLEKGIFTLEDLKKQFIQMEKMGGMMNIMSMIPGMSSLAEKVSNSPMAKNTIKKHIAIINSMTIAERKKPHILNFSRKKRIAKGSASTLQDINILLKQYDQMASVMKQFSGKNPMNSFKNIQSMLSKIKR